MPKYTVKYFNCKALGECIRLLLAYGNEDFEDVRFEQEQWAAIKETTPFGQVPVLIIDGKQYSESTPLSRYLGKLFNVAGATPLEDLTIDMNVDFIHDIRAKLAAVHYEKDEAVQAAKHEELKPVIASLLVKLDSIVAANNGHIALGKLTWADFYFAGVLDYLKMMSRTPDFDAKYPNLQKVVTNVESIPQVQKYVEKRPKCEY